MASESVRAKNEKIAENNLFKAKAAGETQVRFMWTCACGMSGERGRRLWGRLRAGSKARGGPRCGGPGAECAERPLPRLWTRRIHYNHLGGEMAYLGRLPPDTVAQRVQAIG